MAEGMQGSQVRAVAGRAVGKTLTAERTNELLTHAPRIAALERAAKKADKSTAYLRDTIPVKNTDAPGAGDRGQFEPIQIDGAPLFTPSDNADHFRERIVQKASASASTSDLHLPFGVCAEPIIGGQIGRVHVNGYTQARVTVGDAGHTCALPDETNSNRLKSAYGNGAPFVWKESGTGDKWAIIDLSRRTRSYFDAYSYSTQLWKRSTEGLKHPIEYDQTRRDASGGTITTEAKSTTFPSPATTNTDWTIFKLACGGDYTVAYELSRMAGVTANSKHANCVEVYVEKSTDDGKAWAKVDYTETSGAIHYSEVSISVAACMHHLTSIDFDLNFDAGTWLRFMQETEDDSSAQEWNATRAYARIERVAL